MTLLRKQKIQFPMDRVAEALKMGRASVYRWDRISNLIPELFDIYDKNLIDTTAAARLGTFPQEVQKELLKEKSLLSNEIIRQIPAKTIPKNVVETFHDVVARATEPQKVPETTAKWHVKKSEEGYRIIADGAQEEGMQPFVVLLPPDKIKRFQKAYASFILQPEE